MKTNGEPVFAIWRSPSVKVLEKLEPDTFAEPK